MATYLEWALSRIIGHMHAIYTVIKIPLLKTLCLIKTEPTFCLKSLSQLLGAINKLNQLTLLNNFIGSHKIYLLC